MTWSGGESLPLRASTLHYEEVDILYKWFVYMITSEEGLTYTGITHNIEKRLAEHNEGRSTYTKRGTNWRIAYQEEFETRTEARKREKYFKNNAGKEWLRRRGIL